mmetsp:Transcript_14391/g.31802  ORF Transcript_14391/g.31802 Transcript_14391/m.31802 type:complete len:108 (+) Transcript_14391:91-414(+)|eukprot:CAMPEP_0204276106 /NCGR_PEP_ID=MMETSP0468-20130131/27328_1 /ASSEMBLY_ACC=CAM_ASM_000383 /TAXON_ID=2969 /ORGANISM="Oxyrrhis marina" /LENGTH=107 /DNA_ID=CAMNT_0051252613 /DNA_START=89 /DNA_END=412 /DNA_ORIENTATION=+
MRASLITFVLAAAVPTKTGTCMLQLGKGVKASEPEGSVLDEATHEHPSVRRSGLRKTKTPDAPAALLQKSAQEAQPEPRKTTFLRSYVEDPLVYRNGASTILMRPLK